MSGSHGDLFREIGKLVLAAHAGQSIDLSAKSAELAERYENLGVPPDLVAKMIARSLGAICASMAIVSKGNAAEGDVTNGVNGHDDEVKAATVDVGEGDLPVDLMPTESQVKAASALFPSGLRLSVLS